MQTNPIARVRNALEQIEKLHHADHLTPERLRALKERALADLNEAALATEPEEHFEITLDGLAALYVDGKPVRFRRHLAVIEGGAA